jgi:hypothetical protein
MADLQDVINKLTNEGALTRNKGANSTKSVKEILIRNQEEQSTFQSSLITQLADSVGSGGPGSGDPGPSPAEQKEANEDSANADKKQSMFMQKISGGIGWLVESGKKVGKAAKLGAVAFLSTLAIGGLLIALGKFLQSDTFKDLTKFISEVILPKLMEFWEFVKTNWEEIAVLIAGIITVLAIAKFIEIATRVKNAFLAIKTFMLVTMLENVKGMIGGALTKGKQTFTMVATLVKNAFLAVQAFMLQTMLPAVKGMIGGVLVRFASIANKIKLAFIAVQAFMLGTMLPAIVAFMIPLLPFIAIAAAIAFVLYALWEAFQDFRKTLEETGSIGEAIKVAIGKFVGVLLGAIPALFLKLVAFVADLFGFKEFAEKIGDIDPIQFIADSVKSLIDTVVDFFKMLFDFDFAGFAKSLLPGGIKKILGISGSEQTPEQMTQERVRELESKKEDLSNKRSNPENRAEISKYDAEIEALKLSAAESLAKPTVLPKTQLSEAETLEAQRLKPAQFKESASIVEKLEKAKQQAELARQQTAAAGQTNIVDARQSSSVTTTGQSGNSPVVNPKYGNLNSAASGGMI